MRAEEVQVGTSATLDLPERQIICLDAPAIMGAATAKALQWFSGAPWVQWIQNACRYCSADGELYKDVEGVLEGLCSAIGRWHSHSRGQGEQAAQEPLQDVGPSQNLLQLWDGICCLFSAQAKPRHWQQQLLKALKLFTAETRSTAADRVLVRPPSPPGKMACQCALLLPARSDS